MNDRQKRTLLMFHRVLDHLNRHAMKTSPPLMRQMRTRLENTVERVEHLEAEQRRGSSDLSDGSLQKLKTDMRRKRMMPLVRIAKPLLTYASGVERVWHVPHARADSQTIGEHALLMAKALKPHGRLLASAGYPPAFMTAFRRDAERLAKGAEANLKGRQRRSSATLELTREFKKGMDAVTVIEGLLMAHGMKLRGNTEWRYSRRVTKRLGRPRVKPKAVGIEAQRGDTS
jgi:hypothetical protein